MQRQHTFSEEQKKLKSTKVMKGLYFLLAAFATSCSENNNKTTSNSEPNISSDLNEEKLVAVMGDTVNVILQSDDKMKFDKSELRVQEVQVVKLLEEDYKWDAPLLHFSRKEHCPHPRI